VRLYAVVGFESPEGVSVIALVQRGGATLSLEVVNESIPRPLKSRFADLFLYSLVNQSLVYGLLYRTGYYHSHRNYGSNLDAPFSRQTLEVFIIRV